MSKAYEHSPHKREANQIVDRFLDELEARETREEKREKVWELVFGILKAERRKHDQASVPKADA